MTGTSTTIPLWLLGGALTLVLPISSARAQDGGVPPSQVLVSGAPLRDPNVAVHIVQEKEFAERGRTELALFPAAVQVNGKFTQHVGSGVGLVYHLHENFGLQLWGLYNWLSNESAFNAELIDKVRQEAQSATSLLLVWGAQAGIEVKPLYGKFAWFEDGLVHFAVVLSGGAGLGSTKHQIKPENTTGPATFGDTGTRFLGSLGIGLRVLLGERLALRLEVRDVVYTARVDAVNGCDVTDLTKLQEAAAGRRPLSTVAVSERCNVQSWEGTQPGTDARRNSDDLPLAVNLVKGASSDVLNNVGLYAGLSFLF